jgi:hypothetical protein
MAGIRGADTGDRVARPAMAGRVERRVTVDRVARRVTAGRMVAAVTLARPAVVVGTPRAAVVDILREVAVDTRAAVITKSGRRCKQRLYG